MGVRVGFALLFEAVAGDERWDEPGLDDDDDDALAQYCVVVSPRTRAAASRSAKARARLVELECSYATQSRYRLAVFAIAALFRVELADCAVRVAPVAPPDAVCAAAPGREGAGTEIPTWASPWATARCNEGGRDPVDAAAAPPLNKTNADAASTLPESTLVRSELRSFSTASARRDSRTTSAICGTRASSAANSVGDAGWRAARTRAAISRSSGGASSGSS